MTPNGAHTWSTGRDAARDGVGLSGVEPVHHSRLAPVLPLGPAFSQDPTVFGDAGAETYVGVETAPGLGALFAPGYRAESTLA